VINTNDFKRVVYKKNPLFEVLCQVRFSEILKLVDGQPSEFNSAVANDYPIVERFEGYELVAIPSGIAQQPQSSPKKVAQTTFSNFENTWAVTCTSSYLTLTARDYTRWEEFEVRLIKCLTKFMTLYLPGAVTRVGLRYRNIIELETLATENGILDDSELIAPEVRGLLGNSMFNNDSFEQAQSSYQSKNGDMTTILNFGLVRDLSGKKGFLIDADFSSANQLAPQVQLIHEKLTHLHSFSGPVFRACISDKLHELLVPE
jgi:uncharacterized protein (TIGR04255 family)